MDRSETNGFNSIHNVFQVRFIYKSKVTHREFDALLARKPKEYYTSQNSVNTVKSRTVWGKVNTVNDMDSRETCKHTPVCDTKKCVISVACQSVKGGMNTASDNDVSNVSKIQRLTVRCQ